MLFFEDMVCVLYCEMYRILQSAYYFSRNTHLHFTGNPLEQKANTPQKLCRATAAEQSTIYQSQSIF